MTYSKGPLVGIEPGSTAYVACALTTPLPAFLMAVYTWTHLLQCIVKYKNKIMLNLHKLAVCKLDLSGGSYSVSRCVRTWIKLTPEYPFKGTSITIHANINAISIHANINAIATHAIIHAIAIRADINAIAIPSIINSTAVHANIPAIAIHANSHAITIHADIHAIAVYTNVVYLARMAVWLRL